MTLGIVFFELPLFFIGILIDRFGCRFVKLIGILFHIIGWVSLALLQPGRDYLVYTHCLFSSISGSIILITSFASCNYFAQPRAFVSSLLTGALISATIWLSIFQIVIDGGHSELSTLSYIWLSFGVLMLLTSFVFLDWKYLLLNLPYNFDVQLETQHAPVDDRLRKHLKSPLYILVVLFLSIVLIPSVLLSIVWQPWIAYITQDNQSSANRYTFIYTMTTVCALVICPINGFLLGYKADQSQKRKLLNISIVQTICWLFNITLCIISMFLSSSLIIPVIVINIFARSTVVAGCQAVISTFFSSKYIGRLTGVMWTIAGVIILIQFALVKLTGDITKAWRAWLITLSLVFLMSSHLIQIWIKYFQQRKEESKDVKEIITRV